MLGLSFLYRGSQAFCRSRNTHQLKASLMVYCAPPGPVCPLQVVCTHRYELIDQQLLPKDHAQLHFQTMKVLSRVPPRARASGDISSNLLLDWLHTSSPWLELRAFLFHKPSNQSGKPPHPRHLSRNDSFARSLTSHPLIRPASRCLWRSRSSSTCTCSLTATPNAATPSTSQPRRVCRQKVGGHIFEY